MAQKAIFSTFLLHLRQLKWKNLTLRLFRTIPLKLALFVNPLTATAHWCPANTRFYSNANNPKRLKAFRRLIAFLETRVNLQSFKTNMGFIGPISTEI